MVILITGAAGYIGSNIAEFLLNKNHNIIGVDNFNNYYNPKIKRFNVNSFKNHRNFRLYKADILDKEKMNKIFSKEKPGQIIHMAAWAGVTRSIQDPQEYVKNNIEGTVNLAELSVKHNVKNFIFASTSSVYGNNKTPFKEKMDTSFPLAPYPATKKACEVLLYTYSKNFNLPVAIIRIFNPLGPRQRPDLALTQLIRSCLYGTKFNLYQDLKKSGRDYTYIGHLLDAINTLTLKSFPYEIFNLGNAQPVLLNDFINTVEEVVGKKATIIKAGKRRGEMEITYADITKAKKLIAYKPSTSIKKSIEIYYNWFIKQPEWYRRGEY